MIIDQIMVFLSELAILFPAFLLVFTFRGFFKALIAKLMGDDTAVQEGFFSLNPLAHIDFLGLGIMLLLLVVIASLLVGIFPPGFLFLLFILLGVRWSFPVTIEERNFKNYTLGVIFTSLAGSLGCFFLALIFLYLVSYFPYSYFPGYVVVTLVEVFRAVIELSVFFGVLDLIPIPPFQAGKLLQFILPKSWHHYISVLEEYSLYVFLALFFLPGIRDVFFRFLFLLSVLVKKGLLFLVL